MKKTNLPKDYIEYMKNLLKDDFEKYITSLEENPVKGLQVNLKRIEKDTFLKQFQENIIPISYTKNGYIYQGDSKIGNHPFHHAGIIYSQEPSAMIPVNSISIKESDYILDVCAAPGGKSIGASQFINDDGFLFSNEIQLNRCKILLSNIERMGIKNSMVGNLDSKTLSKYYPNTFDIVFVDAPCSGEGMFRKDENACKEWNKELVYHCAERSIDILNNASICVKNDGYLVYSTCTFSKEENEDVIEKFLKNENFVLIDVKEEIKNSTKEGSIPFCRRFYPYYAKGEGQFVAVLKKIKKEDTSPTIKTSLLPIPEKMKQEIQTILKENLNDFSFPLYLYHDNIITIPKEYIPVPSSSMLSVGVKVGSYKHNHFTFHHQFFKAYGEFFKNKVYLSLEDKRISQYLHGEELEDFDNLKGYGVIFLEGVALGGFKASNGRLKNYYPKGLRKQ